MRTPRPIPLLALAASIVACGCSRPSARTFATPEDTAQALFATAKAGNVDELVALFGPEGKELVGSADPADARRNRDVFAAAVRERWRLADEPKDAKTLVVGNEDWPFPIPIVHGPKGWYFDAAAGKEEILARRIGRNELAAIQTCRTYVAAQRLYAQAGHDGHPAGVFATVLRSDPGRQNGLYWPTSHGERRSPLGDLVATAAEEGRPIAGKDSGPSPFHGYYFRILTAQGPAAPGGAKDYVIGGRMSGGFALVAWPATYDSTGVMTFIIGQDGTVREKDLGADTGATGKAMRTFDPDSSWTAVQ